MRKMKTLGFSKIWPLGLVLVLSAPAAYGGCVKTSKPLENDLNIYYSSALLIDDKNELRKELNRIISDHDSYSYRCVWDIIKEADEDPANKNNVVTIYTQKSIPKKRQDRGQNDPDSFNREHLWAKSHGFPKKSQDAYTDAHHIRAADRSVNTSRSDNDFRAGGQKDPECNLCRENKKGRTWEPPADVRGDIARALFYMSIRYEGTDFHETKTPDLKLVDRSTKRGKPEFGYLCDLVQWHNDDPVSAQEFARNNVIYAWQGNRNPFIDVPEWVFKIWGDQC